MIGRIDSIDSIDSIGAAVGALTAQIETEIAPFQAAVDRLDTIPGVNARLAQVIIAETGGDMSRFPTAGQLASWAGMCPGNNESAGKHHSGKTRKGDPWLRGALGEAASAAARTKAPTRPPGTDAWPVAAAPNGPSSPLATACWSPSGTSSPTMSTTPTWAPTTS
jgi:transposase